MKLSGLLGILWCECFWTEHECVLHKCLTKSDLIPETVKSDNIGCVGRVAKWQTCFHWSVSQRYNDRHNLYAPCLLMLDGEAFRWLKGWSDSQERSIWWFIMRITYVYSCWQWTEMDPHSTVWKFAVFFCFSVICEYQSVYLSIFWQSANAAWRVNYCILSLTTFLSQTLEQVAHCSPAWVFAASSQ